MEITPADVKALLDKVGAAATVTTPNGQVELPPSPQAASQASDQAVIVQLSSNPYTISQLETHLKDDAKGQGFKSEAGYTYTRKRETEAYGALAQGDPSSSSLASAFLSGQTNYGSRVRAVEGIRQAAITSNQLRGLAEQLKNLKK